MNWWIDRKGEDWQWMPHPAEVNGNRVRGYYLDMWKGMKVSLFDALLQVVLTMKKRRSAPTQIIIAGYSTGGGVST